MPDKPPQDPEPTPRKTSASDFDVFISHASEDRALVRSISDALSRRGVKCWFDEKDLEPGQELNRQLRDAITRSRMCLLVLSKATKPSKPWISREWSLVQTSAWERDDLDIVPLVVDRVETPPFLRLWQSIRCDRQKPEFDRLVAEILARLSSAKSTEAKEPERGLTEAAQRFREILDALAKSENSDAATAEQAPGE